MTKTSYAYPLPNRAKASFIETITPNQFAYGFAAVYVLINLGWFIFISMR